MQRFRPILNTAGVTETQWRVIRTLADVDASAMSDLADRCAILQPSMTRIVKHLVDAGYINRKIDDTDQRRSLLSITPKGRSLVDDLAPRIAAIYEDIDRRLGELGLESVVELLGTMVDGLSEPSSPNERLSA